MTPRQQAEAMEKEILMGLGFQMNGHAYRQIANYTIDKIIAEYRDMDNYVKDRSMNNAILFWKDVKKEINKDERGL
jgi:hypothetical protein